MKVRRVFTILGCGSSPGVPSVKGEWGACDPANLKNRRTRAALLIQQIADGGTTTVVIDTGPDFREQVIAANVQDIDAVFYSHPHADHIHGIDDLRGYVRHTGRRTPIWADSQTMDRIREGFRYCLETPENSQYPPIVEANIVDASMTPVCVQGAGGNISLEPLLQQHGNITSLGFRIGNFAYCSDVSDFPPETVEQLFRLDLLVIDTLQYRFHPSHLSLAQALEWIERLRPARAVLTHMHLPLDYDTVNRETPEHVEPGYDGMQISYDLVGEF